MRGYSTNLNSYIVILNKKKYQKEIKKKE